ncbi:MAG: zinc-ribbon domain-containing protein [Candidatus Altiarchaeota archaeon]
MAACAKKPGYQWQRMSGVGCVQLDCNQRPHAHWSYTRECICAGNDEIEDPDEDMYVKACYAPSDDPSCPGCLLECITADEICTGEEATQEYCEDYCASYHGPHATAKLVGDKCDCGCKEGYVDDKTLVCVPTKQTCDKVCNEYHGTDMEHGMQAEGKVVGIGCDCKCKIGFIPNKDTLACEKAQTCDEYCKGLWGPNTVTTGGEHPNCKCDCIDGYDVIWKDLGDRLRASCEKVECPLNSKWNHKTKKCECNVGYYMGDDKKCHPLEDPRCGNGVCDDPNDEFMSENCLSCPPDCKCKEGVVCNPFHEKNSIQNKGCVDEAVVEVVGFGCEGPGFPPDIFFQRANRGAEGLVGLGDKFAVGDKITLRKKFNDKGVTTCYPYIILNWKGKKVKLSVTGTATLMYTIEIKKTHIESGWESWGDTAQEYGGKVIIKIIDKYVLPAIPIVGAIWSVVTGADSSIPADVTRVEVNSNIIIEHFDTGDANIYTLEGSPKVEHQGVKKDLPPGKKIEIRSQVSSEPKDFKSHEVLPLIDAMSKVPDCPPFKELNEKGECVCLEGYGPEGYTRCGSEGESKGTSLEGAISSAGDIFGSGNGSESDSWVWLLLGGGLAFVIAGGVFVFLFLIIFVFLRRRRKKKIQKTKQTSVEKSPPQPKLSFCTECGARLLDDARFCLECGKKLN